MTGAQTFAGAADAPELPVTTDVAVEHGDTVPLGECQLEVIRLRGHTPGSVALLYRGPDGSAPVHRRLAVPGRPGQDRAHRKTSRR